MIERYRLEKMSALFSDEVKFRTYFDVEIAAMEAFFEMGKIPKKDVDNVKQNGRIDLERIQQLEKETKHDVIAFTRALSETLGDEKKWVHYGLTSTDVVDTALGVIYQRANDILIEDIQRFLAVLKDKAYEYRKTYTIGRTHGIHADVTVFGLKFALYYDEFRRHLKRFITVRKRIEVGKLSGAVGTFAYTSPALQDRVCELLGLESVNISTQTLQRDRHAEYLSVLVLMASSIEKIATEIRHLQRTEVREVSEYFSKDQKGSSAMPHKKNPIASENMTGCARIMRGYLQPVFENIALWHERDISHSSVERVVLPDALMLMNYMFDRFTKVVQTLVVDEDQMLKNLGLTQGVIYSQHVLTALIDQGLSREEAYDLIQPLAIKAYQEKIDFEKLVKEDTKIISVLDIATIDRCFDLDQVLKHVDTIYERVFKEARS